MAKFIFTALDENKKQATGMIDAPDINAAMQNLSEKYSMVIELEEVKPRKSFLQWLSPGVPAEEVMLFTQQLATMLKSGLTLRHALDILVADTENPKLQEILSELSKGISEGKALSEILEQYPQVFSKLYVYMVRAGETGGKLPQLLSRLVQYIEGAENLKRKVKSALYYPVAIIVISFLISLFIFVFGVRQFEEIYRGLNAQLPPATQAFIDAGNFFYHYWFIFVIGAIALFYLAKYYLRTPNGELWKDKILLGLPIIGNLVRRLAIAKFARTLSTLQSGGVPILKSLELVAGSMGNRVMENLVLQTLQNVKEGESLADPLRESKIFTRMSIGMIASGEESGTLDVMLEEIANFYETQVDVMLKGLVSLLEPFILLGVGAFVAVLIFALGMPLFNLVQVMR